MSCTCAICPAKCGRLGLDRAREAEPLSAPELPVASCIDALALPLGQGRADLHAGVLGALVQPRLRRTQGAQDVPRLRAAAGACMAYAMRGLALPLPRMLLQLSLHLFTCAAGKMQRPV